MRPENTARLFLLGLLLGLPLALFAARLLPHAPIELHARLPEAGGWAPAALTTRVGEPLRLRLTSDDVMHSFAVGGLDVPAVDVKPGEVVETSLTFDHPGKYIYYCTRWCGVNHWRMRGTIEVSGPGAPAAAEQPLYVELGLDLDAPHPAAATPASPPSPARGRALGVTLPDGLLDPDAYRRQAPAESWLALRTGPLTQGLSDEQIWDLVALAWAHNTTPEALETGRQLYAQNCAACHGEAGRGDGVMAGQIAELGNVLEQQGTGEAAGQTGDIGNAMQGHPAGDPAIHPQQGPTNFTDTALLGASPALLQGKILRGGMGTGMPYWGPVFTPDQTWALVDYLWTFQFQSEGDSLDEPE